MDFEQFYQDKYPAGVSLNVDLDKYSSMVDVFDQAVNKYADRPAFSAVGATLTYRDLDTQSRNFAAWLQNKTDLKPGDRIAVQMPNVSQYPVVVFGAMRAGLIVVNTNPLYTTREMEHQFNDSGAKALVVLANMAHNAEKVLPHTGIEHVIVTEIADMHSPLKRTLMNAAVKHLKKMVRHSACPRLTNSRRCSVQGPGKNSPRWSARKTTSPFCSTPVAPPVWPRARC